MCLPQIQLYEIPWVKFKKQRPLLKRLISSKLSISVVVAAVLFHLLLFCFFFLLGTGPQLWLAWNLPCKGSWPWTHRDCPAFASWVPGLKAPTTMHAFIFLLSQCFDSWLTFKDSDWAGSFHVNATDTSWRHLKGGSLVCVHIHLNIHGVPSTRRHPRTHAPTCVHTHAHICTTHTRTPRQQGKNDNFAISMG